MEELELQGESVQERGSLDLSWCRGRRVLVTGATGFIGSWLCSVLTRVGAEVFALCSPVNVNPNVPEGSTGVCGDICDFDRMRDIISSNEIDVVFHFAACAIVRISASDPMTTYRTNVMGTATLLEAARVVGTVRAFIASSSDKAYGDHEALPYTEEHALLPRNTYDTSKACMDMISRSYAHNYGLPVAVVRCSNVYGPGDPNFSRLIPNTIRRILRGQNPVVYSDVAEMSREFIHVGDVVRACLMLCGKVIQGEGIGEAYNIGGTGPKNILSLVQLIHSKMPEATAGDGIVDVVPRSPQFMEIKAQYISAEKLEKLTGWRPLIGIDQGLESTIDFYRSLQEQESQ